MSNDIFDIELDDLKPKKGKNQTPSKHSVIGNKSTISRTVRGAPEVMIKIASSGKSMRNVKATVEYISRSGAVEMEDQNGNKYLGEHAGKDALDDWRDIPKSETPRRESLHVIFSMPRGTPRPEVTEAVRAFAVKEWTDYRYLFAQHNDNDHAHVHVVLNMNPIKGNVRLNPRKGDLQRWRERFAEQLLARGIDANATPRAARGVTKRGKLQAVEQLDAKATTSEQLSKVTQSARESALDELNGQPNAEVPRERLEQGRAAVVAQYGAAIKQLVTGDESDKQLARDTVRFVQNLPPIKTRHDELVAELQERKIDGPER